MEEQLPRILKRWNDGSYELRLIKLKQEHPTHPSYQLERMFKDTMGGPRWQTWSIRDNIDSVIKELTKHL